MALQESEFLCKLVNCVDNSSTIAGIWLNWEKRKKKSRGEKYENASSADTSIQNILVHACLPFF